MGRFKYRGKDDRRVRQRVDRDNEDEDQEHDGGSVPLEEIKKSEEYTRRTEYLGIPKKKYAVCFGYLGTNYQGLQMNPGAVTIESMLEKALFLVGAIPESNYGALSKLSWSRAARTDKGVHAITQCIGVRMCIPKTDKVGFIQTLNTFLPADIRVFDIIRTTKSFNSKIAVGKRRYQYLFPAYMLMDKEMHTELCSKITKLERTSPEILTSTYNELIKYRVTSSKVELLSTALKLYEGTRSYHNFTSGKTINDSQSRRYIIKCDHGGPVISPINGGEWICVSIYGQSFLLNQIRKMIGFAIEIVRHNNVGVDTDLLQQTFGAGRKEVSMAPGTGLYLDELEFDTYNVKIGHLEQQFGSTQSKQKGDDEDDEDGYVNEKLDWYSKPEVLPLLNAYRTDVVWPHIQQMDQNSFNFIDYLVELRNNPYFYKTTEETVAGKESEEGQDGKGPVVADV